MQSFCGSIGSMPAKPPILVISIQKVDCGQGVGYTSGGSAWLAAGLRGTAAGGVDCVLWTTCEAIDALRAPLFVTFLCVAQLGEDARVVIERDDAVDSLSRFLALWVGWVSVLEDLALEALVLLDP